MDKQERQRALRRRERDTALDVMGRALVERSVKFGPSGVSVPYELEEALGEDVARALAGPACAALGVDPFNGEGRPQGQPLEAVLGPYWRGLGPARREDGSPFRCWNGEVVS